MIGQSGEEMGSHVRLPSRVFREDSLSRKFGPLYHVNIIPVNGIRTVHGAVPQLVTGSLDFSNIKIRYGGSDVSSVPQGGSFYLRVGYNANYPGALPFSWSTCITAKATDGSVQAYQTTIESTGGAAGIMDVNEPSNMIMPNHSITLRIYLWYITEGTSTPPNSVLW